MTSLKIIFMGTPLFAVPSLQMLVENHCNIVAVITAPDKPKGRGKKVAISAVKAYALEQNIPLLQPTNLKDETFLKHLSTFKADIQVVVAFRMLPEKVWSMPRLGTFNLHASLLPKYRGAAPINWAIINGETQTGVTTFFLKHQIDTGDMIYQEVVDIEKKDNAGTLHNKLMCVGAQLVFKTISAIASNSYTTIAQASIDDKTCHAPKIFKKDGQIDWAISVHKIYNLIRGLAPYPAAWTDIGGKTYKIFDAHLHIESHDKPMGYIETNHKDRLCIYAKNGFLSIQSIQKEGKKRMSIEEFLCGNSID